MPTQPAELLTSLADLYKVAFLDPASSKKQQTKAMTARSAIVVVGQDIEFRVYVLYAWAGRIPVPDLVTKMFEVNAAFRPRIFGGETDALQTLFQDAVKMIAEDRNEKLPLKGVAHSTRIDKDFRIRSVLQPVISEGRLILQEHQHELIAELEGFPVFQTKDLVDALASAIHELPQKPLVRQRQQEADALAEYLRETGAPAHYIERHVPQARPLSAHPMAAMLQHAGRLRRPLPLQLTRGRT